MIDHPLIVEVGMPTRTGVSQHLRQRANACADRLLNFCNNPDGYLEIGLILVTPSKEIFIITEYQERTDHQEIKFSRAVWEVLKSRNIEVNCIAERVSEGNVLKKTAGFNRRNVSGWSQSNTILSTSEGISNAPEVVRIEFQQWKRNH